MLFLVCLAVPVWASAQEHPAGQENVPETAATKLQEELGPGEKILVIDVRTKKEYADGLVPGSINIPVDELAKKLAEMKVSKDTKVVTVCDHGGRSSRAAAELEKLGYRSSAFCKLESWKKEGFKIETEASKPKSTSEVYRFVCQHYCLSDKEAADLEEHCECVCSKPYRECMKSG